MAPYYKLIVSFQGGPCSPAPMLNDTFCSPCVNKHVNKYHHHHQVGGFISYLSIPKALFMVVTDQVTLMMAFASDVTAAEAIG